MNGIRTDRTAVGGGHDSHDSPKVHRAGVKHEIAWKYRIYREKELLSLYLSPFPSYPLAPRLPARIRVYVREGG